MSEYNIYPAVDADLNFPEAVRRAIMQSPEMLARISNIDNTSDANKPVSLATKTQLDLKAPLASPKFTGTPTGITKAHVGLGNVDNTTDLNKPIPLSVQGAYVPKWKTATSYAVGVQIISPDNRVVTAKVAHTSSAAFSTDIDKWDDKVGVEPYGHMGKTSGFQTIGSSSVRLTFDSAQELRGGFTFDNANDALIVPTSGRYRAHIKCVFSGGGGQGLNVLSLLINGAAATGVFNKPHVAVSKMDGNDIAVHGFGTIPLNKNDKVALSAQSGANAWGDNGYNGAYIELEWVGGL